jgi:hypothetical protein
VDRHLVSVKIGVESRADQRVQPNGLALDQHRVESLNTKQVKRRGTVQHYGVIFYDLLENIPDLRAFAFDQPFGRLDGLDKYFFFELVYDEWL